MLRYLALLLLAVVLFYAPTSAKADGIWQTQCFSVLSTSTDANGNFISATVAPGWCNTSFLGGGGGGSTGFGSNTGFGGGGGLFTSASTTTSAWKKSAKAPPCLRVGDPIDPGTGAKVDVQTDFAMPGEMGLKFERYYMSRNVHGNAAGPGWTDNLDYELHSVCQGTGDPSCYIVTFMRPDGSQLAFAQSYAAAPNAHLAGPFTEIGGGGHATLSYDGNGTYTEKDEDAEVYTFNTVSGAFPTRGDNLATIKDSSGIGWTLSRPSATVTVVTHTSGQQLTFTLSPGSATTASILTMKDPGGNTYVYQSEPGTTLTWDLIPTALASVSLPGSTPTTITYSYKPFNPNASFPFPKGLTEVDYNGVAHDLTTYDTNGNALTTSMADGTQKTSLIYSSNTTGSSVQITNAAGHVSVYQYNANALPISVTGQASAHCAATLSQMNYDGNGNIQSEVDNNGNTTQYTYAPTGQLQQTIEGYGTSFARTTKYGWDTTPGTNRLLSITVVGWSQTQYLYDANNRLHSVSVTNLSTNGVANQTLTTTYNYVLFPNGMVHTVSIIHPSPNNTDTDIHTYDSTGNVVSEANGLGQTTSYSNYNAIGEPQHVVGPNGDTTDFTYDGRGLTLTKTTYPNGVAAEWQYTYDQFGLLYQQSAPNGEVMNWSRLATGMLNTVTHNDKDGTSTETFGYDALGDVTSDVTTRGNVTGLAKTTTYDELGRIYQQLGNNGQTLTYVYDGNSNVHSITNAAGHITTYQYDPLNRVSTVTETGGATPLPPSAAPTLSVPASNATGAYTVSWTSVSGATSYTLQEQLNGGSWTTVQTNGATSWNAGGHGTGTYGYQVKACNVAGCSSWSTAASVTVTIPPGTAPTLTVPASNSTGAYLVSWTTVSGATSYTLQERTNGGNWTTVQTGSASGWNAADHATGVYSYEVSACNAGGCSAWSAVASVAVTIPPSSPPTLTAPSNNSTGNYTVSWTTVSGATSYTLQERTNGGAWSTVQANNSAIWNANNHNSATYSYQIQACNVGGCSGWSAVATVIEAVIPQAAPSLTAPASNTSGSFSVSWTAVTFATSYTLQEQVNGGSWVTVQTGATTSWSATGRVAGTYGYRVQACTSNGCSAWSATALVTVSTVIAVNGQSYTHLWLIPSGQTEYTDIGFDVVNGTTWQVFALASGVNHLRSVITSGAVPAAAVTVQYTWTLSGIPSGYVDAGGSVANAASSAVAVSSNPVSQYTSSSWPQSSPDRGRSYSVKIDFFNAIGANISSSTCTLTAESTGNP